MRKVLFLLLAVLAFNPAFAQSPRALISFGEIGVLSPKKIFFFLYVGDEVETPDLLERPVRAPHLLERPVKLKGFNLSPGAQLIELPAGKHSISSIIFRNTETSEDEYIKLGYEGRFKKDRVYFLGHITADGDTISIDTRTEKLKLILATMKDLDESQIAMPSKELQSTYVAQNED